MDQVTAISVGASRRAFILRAGRLIVAMPLLAACQPSAPAPAPATNAPKPTVAPAAPAAAPAAPPQPTAAPAAAPTPAPAAAAPAAKGGGSLTFWMYKTRLDPLDKWRTDRIQAWSKQSGVAVEVVEIGTSDYGKKVPAAIESKTLPDVMEAGDEWHFLLQSRNLIADLGEVYQKIDKEQKFAPGAKAVATFPDGKVYQIPIGTSGSLMISRDDVLKEAGLTPPPKTWADFFDYAAKAQRPPRVYGIGEAISNTSDANHWVLVMQSYGVRLADDKGKKATFGNYRAEAMEVVNLIVDAYENKKAFPPGVLTWDQTGDNDAFQSGRTIFAFNPLSIPTWLRDNKPDMLEKTGTYVMPSGPKHFIQPVGAVGMNVLRESKALDKAQDLIYFLYEREYYREFFNRAQYGPTTEAHYDFPAFKQHWLSVRVDLAKTGKPNAWPDVNNEAYAESNTAFVVPRMLQRIISDKVKPDQAFDEAAEAYQKIYAKYDK
ncbi:MAG: extracellular solute-binding protein [Chloroflexota bacterium]